MTTRITDKDFYSMIKNLALDTAELPIENELVIAWADKKLGQLEKKKEAAAKRAAEKKSADDPLTHTILEVLTEEFQTIGDIAAQIEGPDVTVSKVGYRLNALFKAGKIAKDKVTLEGEGRKRHVVGYKNI